MTIKNILVPVAGPAANKAQLDTALALAKRSNAHLDVVVMHPDPVTTVPFMTESVSAGLIDSIIEAAKEAAEKRGGEVRAAYDAWCKQHDIAQSDKPGAAGVTASFGEATGREGDILTHRGRLADLIVVTRPETESPAPLTLETALMEVGVPVIIAPPSATADVGSRIALGWNGSAEATRAAAAAMSLLAGAESVTVFTAPEGAEVGVTAAEFVTHLAWHGVKATSETLNADQEEVGETLLAAARKMKADLIVMGGYGHSRVRELVLGGVTRHLLASADLPLFMAH